MPHSIYEYSVLYHVQSVASMGAPRPYEEYTAECHSRVTILCRCNQKSLDRFLPVVKRRTQCIQKTCLGFIFVLFFVHNLRYTKILFDSDKFRDIWNAYKCASMEFVMRITPNGKIVLTKKNSVKNDCNP